MIHYEDLLVARIVNRQVPAQRDILMAALETLHDGSNQRSLLAGLMAAGVLSREQAHYVHGMVEKTKRDKAVSIYAYLLTRQGLPGPQIRQHMDALGPACAVESLAARVLEVGLVSPQQEQQVRFQAKIHVDQEQAQQVRAYLESREQAGGASPDGTSISGVYRLPQANTGAETVNPALAIPTAAVIVTKTSAAIPVPQLNLDPPQFAVPDWVDTSDERTGDSLNQYRILGRVGAGAMGIVYLADHPSEPTRPVALKVLPPGADEDAVGRFKREILANGFFSHEGVIDVYDAGKSPSGHHYLAMEFFDGEDLAQILDSESKLDPVIALELMKQCFAVLAGTHDAGIVHRDVKPENILVSRDGKLAKLMDFGIAIIRDLGEFQDQVFKTVEGGSTGTPQYMSPEQAAGDLLQAPSDVYSLCLCLYQCLSGALPFESETSSGFMACHMMEDPKPLAKQGKSMKALPHALHDFLKAAFDKDPANRPTATDGVDMIDLVLPKVQEQQKRGSSGRLFGFLWRGRGG